MHFNEGKLEFKVDNLVKHLVDGPTPKRGQCEP